MNKQIVTSSLKTKTRNRIRRVTRTRQFPINQNQLFADCKRSVLTQLC